jgi:hypothetical protein
MPRCCSASARLKPPMPPPTMAIFMVRPFFDAQTGL